MDGVINWVSSLYSDHFHQARSNSFPLSLPPFHQIGLTLGEELRRWEGWAGELTKLYHISITCPRNHSENITAAFSEPEGTHFDHTYPLSLT